MRLSTIEAVKLALRVAPLKGPLSVLQTIRFSACRVEATDLDCWISLEADYSGPDCILPAAALRDASKKGKTLAIGPSTIEGHYKLKTDAVGFDVQGVPDEDYPMTPSHPLTEVEGHFSMSRLRRAHERLSPCISEDETRPALQVYGMEVYPGDAATATQGAVRLVACNGQILGTAMARHLGRREGEPQLLNIPPRVFDLALRLKDEMYLKLHHGVETGTEWIMAQCEGHRFLARRAVSVYPTWTKILPQHASPYSFTLKTDALASVLAATTKAIKAVHLAPGQLDCKIGWADEHTGGKVSERACLALATPAADGHPRLEFAVNRNYIVPILARKARSITFGLGAQATSEEAARGYDWSGVMVVEHDQTADEKTLVMPMRMDKIGNLLDSVECEAARAFMVEQATDVGNIKPAEPESKVA